MFSIPSRPILLALVAIHLFFMIKPCDGFQNSCVGAQTGARHRRACVTIVDARRGPNRDKPAEFFSDFAVLEQEIQAYLKDRETVVLAEEKKVNNPFLNFFSANEESILTKQEKRTKQKKLDILSYAELTKYGYQHLVEPISKQGGYIEISKKLGLKVENATPYDDRVKILDMSKEIIKRPERGLTLGSALDARLDSINEVDWKKKKQDDIFASQNAMAGIVEEQKKTTMVKDESPVYVIAEKKEVEYVYPPQPFELNLVQRLYVVLFAFTAAFANGQATSELGALAGWDLGGGGGGGAAAAAAGAALEAARAGALVLVLTHAAAAPLAAAAAAGKRRSAALWFAKGLVSGLPAFLEIKGLDSWEDLIERNKEAEIEKKAKKTTISS